MPDKDPATAAAEAAAKKLIEVAYGDLLQPAARVVGAELGEFVQTIVVAGRGFGYLIRETYQPFVLRALQRVPKDQRVLPRPEMLGPILESISYQRPDSGITGMFEALLAAEMDTKKYRSNHPSFAYILRQMSSAEAMTIKYLHIHMNITVVTFPHERPIIQPIIHEASAGWKPPTDDLNLLFDRLMHSGLMRIPVSTPEQSGGKYAGRVHSDVYFLLSDVGKAFAAACMPDP
jgi:hypothetical protein